MKNSYKILLCFIFLVALMCKENKMVAQPIDEEDKFKNRIITTDNFPKEKKVIDSIMNHAPYIFEGRMIGGGIGYRYKQDSLNEYSCYLFEIEKVYRGGERLKEGTVEIVTRKFRDWGDPPNVGFANTSYFIFAQEVNVAGLFEANNDIKLALFYATIQVSGRERITSCFQEMATPYPIHYASNFGLSFKTKEDVRDFLATYSLLPIDRPKADTLMTFTKQRADDIRKAEENRVKQTEKLKVLYQKRLELEWKMNNSNKKRINKKEIDNNLLKYEKASDSIRQRMFDEQQDRYFRILDSIAKENQRKSQQGQTKSTSSEANLTFSIQNTKNTTISGNSFLEFDIMVRAHQQNTYPYMFFVVLQYESDHLQKPFKKDIFS